MNRLAIDGPAAQQGVMREIDLLVAEVGHQQRRMSEIESNLQRHAGSGLAERLRIELASIREGYEQLERINAGSDRDVSELMEGGA